MLFTQQGSCGGPSSVPPLQPSNSRPPAATAKQTQGQANPAPAPGLHQLLAGRSNVNNSKAAAPPGAAPAAPAQLHSSKARAAPNLNSNLQQQQSK